MQLHRWKDGIFRIDGKLEAVGNSYFIHSLSHFEGQYVLVLQTTFRRLEGGTICGSECEVKLSYMVEII